MTPEGEKISFEGHNIDRLTRGQERETREAWKINEGLGFTGEEQEEIVESEVAVPQGKQEIAEEAAKEKYPSIPATEDSLARGKKEEEAFKRAKTEREKQFVEKGYLTIDRTVTAKERSEMLKNREEAANSNTESTEAQNGQKERPEILNEQQEAQAIEKWQKALEEIQEALVKVEYLAGRLKKGGEKLARLRELFSSSKKGGRIDDEGAKIGAELNETKGKFKALCAAGSKELYEILLSAAHDPEKTANVIKTAGEVKARVFEILTLFGFEKFNQKRIESLPEADKGLFSKMKGRGAGFLSKIIYG